MMTLREQIEQLRQRNTAEPVASHYRPWTNGYVSAIDDVLALLPAEPMTCATCKHARWMRREMRDDQLLCTKQPEEFPLHWQDVSGWEGFGCTAHDPKDTPK